MNKKLMFLDIICYGVIPYLAWSYLREPFGDYIAILMSTIPGFVYTVYRFAKERQFNIAGLFIISSLLISTVVNLLSSSAGSMLWNQVYLGLAFVFIYLLSMIIKKPLALYFAVDFAYLQGYRRENSRALYKTKGIFMWFQLMNLLFAFCGLFQNGLKAWLIKAYGAGGYDQVIIYMNINGWIFNVLIMAGYFFINYKIMQFTGQFKKKEQHPSAKEV